MLLYEQKIVIWNHLILAVKMDSVTQQTSLRMPKYPIKVQWKEVEMLNIKARTSNADMTDSWKESIFQDIRQKLIRRHWSKRGSIIAYNNIYGWE